MLLKHFWLLFLLSGCAHGNKRVPSEPSTLAEQLAQKRDSWLAELAAAADKNTGWLSSVDCDGTLWEGEALAAGHPTQLVLAEWESGEIHRRLKTSGECYPKESDSTFSRDMLMGYILGMYSTKDLDALSRLVAYGTTNNWVLGKPNVIPSPEGLGLLGRAVASLGGTFEEYSRVPNACLPPIKDYEFHTQTLAIILDGEINNGISDVCFATLKRDAESFPDDALLVGAYSVYAGGTDIAMGLLLKDDYKCPSYVRPVPAYCTIHKAFAAQLILKDVEKD